VGQSAALSRRLSELLGVGAFAAAVLWFVALATHDPNDPVWFFRAGPAQPVANFIGPVGAFAAELSFQLLGYASFFLPVILVVAGWHFFWCRTLDAGYTKATGATVLLACLCGLLSLGLGVNGRGFAPGGYAGNWISARLAVYLNGTGTTIVLFAVLFIAVILSTQFSFGRAFAAVGARLSAAWFRSKSVLARWREERRREKRRREVIAKHTRRTGREPIAAEPSPNTRVAVAASATAGATSRPIVTAERGDSQTRASGGPVRKEWIPVATPQAPAETSVKAPAERRRGDFSLPPVALLDAPRTERKIDERELIESARLLEEKCREFSVDGNVVQIHPGPVVTTLEFKPEAGVKYSKVTGLAEDLCLVMQAESVLIERLPGKSTVGIQIPNRTREQISLRDLLESEQYRRSPSKLALALGKTIHGEPFITDLAGMPHLLIAGATGTGKSVAINAMLTSILYRATPEEVRLILIDPKRLELGIYEHIPHLLTPVVVDPKQAANALAWAVKEMEERYKTLAAEGVRNIEQYNRNIRHFARERAGLEEGDDRKVLPFIVVVIDELADLMMVASNDVEESIARLAQMARAVGIHLILATQRPSVDVITGLIKANLPARISFRVSSKVDSRTILDGNGAEHLLGRGDMLYLPPASSRLIRVHGAYISEQESARLASFLCKQGRPVYDESILAEDKNAESIEFEKDDRYDEAARIVVSSGQASISYLQRRLRIGFSRAARLIDMMEVEGLVSGAVAGKPREVLVERHYFDEVDRQLR
jgi:DNA segregation ATPase FtsK/SpoIIIE, S-DNA-T family